MASHARARKAACYLQKQQGVIPGIGSQSAFTGSYSCFIASLAPRSSAIFSQGDAIRVCTQIAY